MTGKHQLLRLNSKDLNKWFCGNAQAVNFMENLSIACSEWIRMSQTSETDCMGRMTVWMAFGKELHPFFVQHAAILRPVVLTSCLQLRTIASLDPEQSPDQPIIEVLSHSLLSVVHVTAWICGGDQWAEEIAPEIYRTMWLDIDGDGKLNEAPGENARLN
ncbi:hypothetical protein ROJ8625_03779 [Roseivivax jejudonensis]|uniref:Uncharacterized protein n=1 Tax=Roseivivax jejudonensis TaxID=1529041 RepID=A0A1X7A6P4_9RHOB|nr:hypothetical protein [Roseivivax jejudonensis]SLN72031.1 hypothetical protein ROJ8625_03779 [Roseivivax jejudonensis]